VSNHSSRDDRPITAADEIRRSWNRTFLGSLGFGVLLLGLFLVGLLFVAIGLAFYLTAGWTIAVARILRGSSEFVWPVAAALTLAIVALIASLRQPRQDTQSGQQERFAHSHESALASPSSLHCWLVWISHRTSPVPGKPV
jgi:hypothetical protein